MTVWTSTRDRIALNIWCIESLSIFKRCSTISHLTLPLSLLLQGGKPRNIICLNYSAIICPEKNCLTVRIFWLKVSEVAQGLLPLPKLIRRTWPVLGRQTIRVRTLLRAQMTMNLLDCQDPVLPLSLRFCLISLWVQDPLPLSQPLGIESYRSITMHGMLMLCLVVWVNF